MDCFCYSDGFAILLLDSYETLLSILVAFHDQLECNSNIPLRLFFLHCGIAVNRNMSASYLQPYLQ